MSFAPSIDIASLDGADGFNIQGAGELDLLGYSIALGGVNGDGLQDALIGVPTLYDPGGAVLIFGSTSGFGSELDVAALDATRGFVLEAFQEDGRAGKTVALGDVNGDGFDDPIVVAPYSEAFVGGLFGSVLQRVGVTHVLFSGEAGAELDVVDAADGASDGVIALGRINGENGFRFTGSRFNDDLGEGNFNPLAVGDFNGDGFDDISVGARQVNYGSGLVATVFGGTGPFEADVSTNELDGTDGFILTGGLPGDDVGGAVASSDLNGDGLADIIAGGNFADGEAAYAGSVFVRFGKVGGFQTTDGIFPSDGFEGFRAFSPAELGQTRAGQTVAAGDVNGDGFDDLIFAMPLTHFGGYGAGAAAVVFGPFAPDTSIDVAALNGANGFILTGGRTDEYLGHFIATGDVNGDGVDDILIGGDPFGNRAFVIFGRESAFAPMLNVASLDGTNGFTIDAPSEEAEFDGAAIGDINGDEFGDVFLGDTRADAAGRNLSGQVSVIFGAATGPLDRTGDGGADRFAGGSFSDVFRGLAGDDVITSGGGDDVIEGGDGSDDLSGGDGDDAISGGADDDVIEGGADNDRLSGGSGADIFLGLLGRDTIDGGGGGDELDLRDIAGSVEVKLDNGTAVTSTRDKARFESIEKATGGDGDDLLRGNEFNNRLVGRVGEDLLLGRDGDDMIFGNSGNDTLKGDDGADVLTGGNESDDLDGGAGDDMIFGGRDDDRGNGGAGDDVIDGGDGDDLFFANEGNDILLGGAGADKLRGQEDDDRLEGGDDDDSLRGGEGNDVILGDAGRDTLQGEAGDDVLTGGAGKDNIFGGAGVDRFVMIDDFEFDKIFDFEDGLEFLDFREHTTIDSFDDLQIQAFGAGGVDTRIRDRADTSDFIVLVDVDVSNITEDDFLF